VILSRSELPAWVHPRTTGDESESFAVFWGVANGAVLEFVYQLDRADDSVEADGVYSHTADTCRGYAPNEWGGVPPDVMIAAGAEALRRIRRGKACSRCNGGGLLQNPEDGWRPGLVLTREAEACVRAAFAGQAPPVCETKWQPCPACGGGQ
jgi:hypothetical protein